MCFSPYLGVCVGGGGTKGSRAQNVLMQFSGLGSSKIEISETDFFDTLTIQNDQISYVKHVLDPLHVFFTLVGGVCGGVPRGVGFYAVFRPRQLKNGIFRNRSLPSSRCLAQGNRIFFFIFLANHPFLVKQVLSDGWVPGQAGFTLLPYWGEAKPKSAPKPNKAPKCGPKGQRKQEFRMVYRTKQGSASEPLEH